MSDKTCYDSELLSAYLDSDLDRAKLSEIRAHLEECSQCSAVCDDLGSLKSGLTALKDAQPVRDLWPAIERAKAKETGSGLAGWFRRYWMVPASAAAGAAAVVLVLLLVGPGQQTGNQPTGPVTALQAVAKAETEYRKAIDSLEGALTQSQEHYDPKTRKIVQEGLAQMNETIEKCRAALKNNENDSKAQEAMLAAYQYKVDFLTDLVADQL